MEVHLIRLLNNLYVTAESSYFSLDGENAVVLEDKTEIGRVPLHNLEREKASAKGGKAMC